MTTAGLVFDAASGLLFLGLGAFVAFHPPRRPLNRWFGLYAIGLGVLVLALNITHLLEPQQAGRLAETQLAGRIRIFGAVGGLLAMLGLSGIVVRIAGRHTSGAALGLSSLALLLLLVLGMVPWPTTAPDGSGSASVGGFVAYMGTQVVVRAAGIAAALALALIAGGVRARAPHEALGIFFLTLGILPVAAFATGDSLVFRWANGDWAHLAFDLVSAGVLALAAGIWVGHGRHAEVLRGSALLLAALTPALMLAAVAFYFVDPTGNTGAAGAVRTGSVIVLAYAILRRDLFGIQPHLQTSLRRGTVAMGFAAAFLVGGQVGERFLAPPYDLLASMLGVVLLFLALDPLRRAADRLAGSAEQSMQRSVEAPVDGVPVVGALLQKRYRVEQRLGEGGYGFTLLCHDTLLGRPVVAKVLPSRPGTSAHLEEAQRAAAIVHPNVVQVFDVGQDGAWGYIIMEYVAGGSLAHRLGRPWSPARVAALADDLLPAVAACHAAGIVHGDVKPENILLDLEGRAKLADFGAARPTGIQHTAPMEGAAGTVAYLAPEQVRGGSASPASDLHACAVVLAVAATGRHPLVPAEADMFAVRQAILVAKPDLKGVPAPLAGVLRKALAKEPGGRFPGADEMWEAVQDALRAPARSGGPA